MEATKIGTNDIRNLALGILEVKLPDYAACETAKNLVTRVKARYPLEDGDTFTTNIVKKTCTIIIKKCKPEEVNRKYSI